MTSVESDYYDFMNFDRDSSRSGLSHYLQFFSAGPVLELASGRGDFLRLLTDRGIAATGVDIDAGMVALSEASGVEVHLGDALEHLADQPDGSLGGLFCAHFLEHLPSELVATVYEEAGRVLAPGGTFVAAVPSAASLSVLRFDFWRDPTHVRFYDPMLLGFFASRGGLTVTESGANPLNDPGPPPQVIPSALDGATSLRPELVAVRDHLVATRAAAATIPPAPPERRFAAARKWLRDRLAIEPPPPAPDQTALSETTEDLLHLVAVLDDRLQQVQHQTHSLGIAYRSLLATLYPPNEVYVVARRPLEEPHA